MTRDIRKLILDKLAKDGTVKAADISGATGLSRAYVHRFFQQLKEEGMIVLVGKANTAHYVLPRARRAIEGKPVNIHRLLRNRDLRENVVLESIKDEGPWFARLAENVGLIVDYSFTEMVNNAIEHSGTDTIDISLRESKDRLQFEISDRGVGIFNNIMAKKGLDTTLDAIQDLLKGKQTTAPEFHSGEGIFFTSKMVDHFSIRSSGKWLVIDNEKNDVYVKDSPLKTRGTKVSCSIRFDSTRTLSEVFGRYTDPDSVEFTRTAVSVRLYRNNVQYVSRSQARRIVVGLERFKTIELDFQGIDTVGQAFADEIFRVWQVRHPESRIVPRNMNENVEFMVRRAGWVDDLLTTMDMG
ncbi:MAG: Histidine kinase-, DNA gyrase B-, and HSP90-like ATPase [Syntrophorhabdus sp. PtaB.Bin047]|jgi:anti-sigma regulatory factor (Ser/Thr protein kinase)/biotin operon repressor|nr:MAG: Histidine kinase-, DNA gyrase B-, and HSP90-like ATPase [Syntrophorhabdus sp. PtaB.Bin047]HOD72451.1 DUF4325 domain-containing protein [Deltaproteobacteria bacterium]